MQSGVRCWEAIWIVQYLNYKEDIFSWQLIKKQLFWIKTKHDFHFDSENDNKYKPLQEYQSIQRTESMIPLSLSEVPTSTYI